MAGAGSYSDSVVSESSGTVLSLSFIAPDWKFDPSVLVSFHRGLRRQDMVCFDCADSGGVCLEWFKNNFYGSESYDWLESRLTARVHAPDAPLFLPYLTGLNPPEYFKEAAGAFVELTLRHDGIDMAYAVMEGVAHLLRSNIDYCEEHLLGEVKGIVSTGGGSASAFWSQLKADACDRTIVVPIETQSVCRGAAVIGLVEAGVLAGLDEAESLAPVSTKVYTPSRDAVHRARYERFQQLRDLLYATRKGLNKMRLSCSSPMVPGKTLTAQAEALREWGFDAISIFYPFDQWGPEIRDEILGLEDRTGIVPCEFAFSDPLYGHLMDDDLARREASRAMYREAARLCAELGAVTELEFEYGAQDPLPLFDPYQSLDQGQRDAFTQMYLEILEPVQGTGARVLLEPLNRYESRYLNSVADCVDAVYAVGHPHGGPAFRLFPLLD